MAGRWATAIAFVGVVTLAPPAAASDLAPWSVAAHAMTGSLTAGEIVVHVNEMNQMGGLWGLEARSRPTLHGTVRIEGGAEAIPFEMGPHTASAWIRVPVASLRAEVIVEREDGVVYSARLTPAPAHTSAITTFSATGTSSFIRAAIQDEGSTPVLPHRLIGYDGIDRVELTGRELARLDPRAHATLLEWARSGGELVLATRDAAEQAEPRVRDLVGPVADVEVEAGYRSGLDVKKRIGRGQIVTTRYPQAPHFTPRMQAARARDLDILVDHARRTTKRAGAVSVAIGAVSAIAIGAALTLATRRRARRRTVVANSLGLAGAAFATIASYGRFGPNADRVDRFVAFEVGAGSPRALVTDTFSIASRNDLELSSKADSWKVEHEGAFAWDQPDARELVVATPSRSAFVRFARSGRSSDPLVVSQREAVELGGPLRLECVDGSVKLINDSKLALTDIVISERPGHSILATATTGVPPTSVRVSGAPRTHERAVVRVVGASPCEQGEGS